MRFARRMTSAERDKVTQDRLWALAFMIVGLIVGAVVAQFAPVATAEAAGFGTIVVLMAARLFDAWVERRLYWLFMTAVVVAHLALVVAAPGPLRQVISKAGALFLVVDLILVILAGELVHRLARRREADPSRS